ncbi:hypothetical protein ACXWOR_10510, partial [Streptococcus pyogenes]
GYGAKRESKLGVRDSSLMAAMETTGTGDNCIPLLFHISVVKIRLSVLQIQRIFHTNWSLGKYWH